MNGRAVRVVVLIVLSGLALYHISLQDRGALAWPDEFLYKDALGAARAVTAGDIRTFGRHLNEWGTRPVEHLLRLGPALLQNHLHDAWDLPVFHPASLRLAVAQNVLVWFLLGIIFFRLALFLFEGDGWAAAVATVVYASLPSSQVWIRHLVPYDAALLLSLFALWLGLRLRTAEIPAFSLRRAAVVLAPAGLAIAAYPLGFYLYRPVALWLAIHALVWTLVSALAWARGIPRRVAVACVLTGFVSGLALATYPAYYSFQAAIPVIIGLGGGEPSGLLPTRGRLRGAVLVALSMTLVVFGFEVLARLGDISYLGGARLLSQTITQGSFEEGYVFLPKYLVAAEGVIGVILVAGCALYVLGAVRRLGHGFAKRGGGVALLRCTAVFFALYVVYGTQSTVLHRMTFTGRYVGMYIPFVVLGAVAAIAQFRGRGRRFLLGAVSVASALSLGLFAKEYSRVDYPINVLASLRIGFDDVVPANRVYESNIVPDYNLPVKVMMPGTAFLSYPDDPRFMLVNFGWFDLEGSGFRPISPPPDARLLYRARHLQCFPISGFEAYGTDRRRQLEQAACELRVYRRDPPLN